MRVKVGHSRTSAIVSVVGASLVVSGIAWAYMVGFGAGSGAATSGSEVRELDIDAVITGDILSNVGADVVVTVANSTGSTLKWSPTTEDLHPTVSISGAEGSCDPDKWDFYWNSAPTTPIVLPPGETATIGTGNVGVSTRYQASGCRSAELTLHW